MSHSLTRKAVSLLGALAAGLAVSATAAVATAGHADAATGGRTFYVSPAGSARAAGTSAAAPLRSLDDVSRLDLHAGDKVLLQRGGHYTGTLNVSASGSAGHRIKIGAYGPATAANPDVTGGCLVVNGSYVTVTGLFVHGCTVGIDVFGNHVTVRHNAVTDTWAGIQADQGSSDVLIARNRLYDNKRMAPNTPGANDDNGAVGVLVNGDRVDIRYNTMTGNYAPSEDYGTDGSAVEIYGGIGTTVSHNIAHDNETFTELGDSRTANTTYDHNIVTSDLDTSDFLVTRGAQDTFGPVANTTATANQVTLTGDHSTGVYCWGGCNGTVLAIWNNTFDVEHAIDWTDGPVSGGNNTYVNGYLDTDMLPGDHWAAGSTPNMS